MTTVWDREAIKYISLELKVFARDNFYYGIFYDSVVSIILNNDASTFVFDLLLDRSGFVQ